MHAGGGATRRQPRDAGPSAERRPSSPREEIGHDLVIFALALASVAIGVYQLTRQAPTPSFGPLDAIDLAIALFFIADYAYHAWREGWRDYLRAHWWELPALIPFYPSLVACMPVLDR